MIAISQNVLTRPIYWLMALWSALQRLPLGAWVRYRLLRRRLHVRLARLQRRRLRRQLQRQTIVPYQQMDRWQRGRPPIER